MFKKSWAKRLVAGASALLCSGTLLAAPVTVGFEAFPDIIGADPAQYASATYEEQGLRVTLAKDSALIDACNAGSGYACATGNSSGLLQALNNPVVTLSTVGVGFTFTLQTLDAAFLANDVGNFSGLDLRLSVTGQMAGGGTLQSLLGLVESSTPNEFEFASYSFGSNWTGLTSVSIGACLFDGASCVNDDASLSPLGLVANDLQFALDNITVDIPEPSAAWLAALSLGALVATRRRAAR